MINIHNYVTRISNLFISALPGLPQNVTAVKIAPTPIDNCVIIVHWMPPKNAAESNITHYVIDSPFGTFITSNTSIEIALLVHHCEVQTYIRIHASDYCNRNGLQTNDILAQLLIIANATSVPLTSGTAFTTEMNNGRRSSEFMFPRGGGIPCICNNESSW